MLPKSLTSTKFDDSISCQFSITKDEKGGNILEGYVYKEGLNAYYQQVYIGKFDEEYQKECFYPMKMTEKSWKANWDEKYSWCSIPLSDLKTEKSWKANWDEKYSWCSIPLSDLKINKKEELLKDGWKVYLENNGEVYWQNLSIE